MTTRCMMQAQYFCSGTESEAEFRHYGLATPIYTHFTSPIRRYSGTLFVSHGYQMRYSHTYIVRCDCPSITSG